MTQPDERDIEKAREVYANLHKGAPQDIETIAAALAEERERCAKIADAHKGAAARRRQEKGQRLSKLSPEAQASITDEERGEDIAADIIGRNIRAGSKP